MAEWVVLELSPRSEGEDPSVVASSIRRSLPKAEIFIPAVTTQIGDDKRTYNLVDGYAFATRTYPDAAYFRLEGSKFIQSVLTSTGGGRQRRIAAVYDADIAKMRSQIQTEIHQGIGIGDKVLITTGPYRNINATVLEELPEDELVQVFVKLRSKQTILTIPRSGLVIVERAPVSPLLSRITTMSAWLRQVRPVLLWNPASFNPGFEKFTQAQRFDEWLRRGTRLFSVVSFAQGGLDAFRGRVAQHAHRFSMVSAYERQFNPLLTLVRSYNPSFDSGFDQLESKFLSLAWMIDVDSRLQAIGEDVESLGHKSIRGVDMVQNVIVDGHNLAYRCLHALGLGELKTASGEHSGVILGMLRSLGALQTRFPGARIYVAWDGSSKRRKKMFADYKATRLPTPPQFGPQVEKIKQILPTLGIRQLGNPDEEADDIIAAALRSQFAGQANLIFSSDRDLLQLVTPTTRQLVPGVGIRKEIFYDEAMVKANFGVTPEKLTQLRAFSGDATDNIPGVPRVPKKILCSLIQTYGSVDGVYTSGLTGLTRGQYDRLQSAEPQVRINLTLMSLIDVPVTETSSNPDSDQASTWLRELEIMSEPILEPFFGAA